MVNELTVSLIAGLITGVQVRGADGVARALKLGDLAGALDRVNESAWLSLDAVTMERDSIEAALTAYKAQGLAAAQAVLDAKDKQTCDAIARGVKKNENERQIAAAEIAAADALALVERLKAA